MKLADIINAIESYAPRSFQEKWDNSGLQIALPADTDEVSGALLCVDVTEGIIAEAIARGCNLVISHHPLIFKGFKRLTGATVQERAAMAAIRGGVAVYSAHTSLDSTRGGVSYAMAELLGAEVIDAIQQLESRSMVMTVFCPRTLADDVRLLMLDHNAGEPLCAANTGMPEAPECASADIMRDSIDRDPIMPSIVHTPLCRVEGTVANSRIYSVSEAIKTLPGGGSKCRIITAPAPADPALGLGVFAVLPGEGIKGSDFVALLHEKFGTPAIRTSMGYRPDMKVRRIALCGGAGGEFIGAAAAAGVDAYVSADIRYHDFADAAESRTAVFDIGHFESESCAKSIFYHIITKKIANFAVYYSETETNPVKYL